MLGDFWTLAIIQVLIPGEKRFKEIQNEISGISPTTLSSRLKKLESEGLISRKTETVDKLSVVYALTKKGHGILPVLREIKKFSANFS